MFLSSFSVLCSIQIQEETKVVLIVEVWTSYITFMSKSQRTILSISRFCLLLFIEIKIELDLILIPSVISCVFRSMKCLTRFISIETQILRTKAYCLYDFTRFNKQVQLKTYLYYPQNRGYLFYMIKINSTNHINGRTI